MNSRSSLWTQRFSSFVGTAESSTKSRWKGLDKHAGAEWVSRPDAKTSKIVDALYTLQGLVPTWHTLQDATEAHIVVASLLGERCTA